MIAKLLRGDHRRLRALDRCAGRDFKIAVDEPRALERLHVGDYLSCSGWVVATSGVASVEIEILGSAIRQKARLGFLRPDVAQQYPDIPDSGKSGFYCILHVVDIPAGWQGAVVSVENAVGEVARWRLIFRKERQSDYARWKEVACARRTHEPVEKERKSSVAIGVVVRSSADIPALQNTLRSLSEQDLHAAAISVLLLLRGHPILPALRALAETFGVDHVIATESWTEAWLQAVRSAAFTMLLDAGDRAKPHMLRSIEQVIRDEPGVDLIYADEEHGEGEEARPVFKPGWSPQLLKHCNYLGRPWIARTEKIAAHLTMADGRDEKALLSAFASEAAAVVHVADILVSRPRQVTWPHIVQTQSLLLSARHDVSIIIPTCLQNPAMVSVNIQTLENAAGDDDVEVILLVNNANAEDLGNLKLRKTRILDFGYAPFNWSRLNNVGASYARFGHFVFMNDDVMLEDVGGLRILVDTLRIDGVGVAAPLLLYPDGTLQHAGLGLTNEGGRHLFRFQMPTEVWPPFLISSPREVSAVTGACLATSRRCFERLGGFAEDLPIVGNDVDYCLRARNAGFAVLLQSAVRFVHFEALSRGSLDERSDIAAFRKKWSAVLQSGDDFLNPNVDERYDDWRTNPAPTTTFAPVRSWRTAK